MRGLKHNPEAEQWLRDSKDQVLRTERAGRATKYPLDDAGSLVARLEWAWQPDHVIEDAKGWVDRALKIPAEAD